MKNKLMASFLIFLMVGSSLALLAGGAEIEFTDAHRAVLDALAGGGAFFFRQLAGHGIVEGELKAALWELIWAGWVTGDTFAPVRALLGGAPGARKRSAPAHPHRKKSRTCFPRAQSPSCIVSLPG